MPSALPDGLHPNAADAVLDPGRLAALYGTALLDTEPESEFDRLTSLTSRSTGAPVALLALIGEDRSFFKSAHGLPETPPGRAVPLSHSMCQHVVATEEPLVVDDTQSHPLLRDNKAVTEMGAGAYLGVPVRSPSGHVLGTLCAVDLEAREWSADDIATLLATAAAAQGEVALRAEREAREAAELMSRLKTTFLSNMSHEIRTPLTAILGCAELLADEVQPECQDLTDSILSGGQRLMTTLDSILDLAQIEAGQIAVTPCAMCAGDVLESAVQGLRPAAASKGLTLSVCTPDGVPAVSADPRLLTRIAEQLVENAIKFTDAGRVDVSARYADGRLHLEVADTGIGIPASDLERVLGEFQQASEGHARTHQGVGIGLALVRRLAEMMNGEVTIESEVGVGTRVIVSVPAPPSP